MHNTLRRISKDFDVTVIGDGVSTHKNLYPNIKWVDIKIKRKISLWNDLCSLIQLYIFFKKNRPNIVHSIMHKAALLTAVSAFLANVPVRINTFTSQYWMKNKSIFSSLYFYSDWLVNRLNTYCLTDSPSQSALLQEHGINQKNGRKLPVLLHGSLSGVDIDRYNLDKFGTEVEVLGDSLGISKENNFIFTFLARKCEAKGAIDVLNAFFKLRKNVPSARLLFIGPDESDGKLSTLRNFYPELFLDVIDINHSIDNPEEFLALTNVLCLPSYMEGFGSIVIEAAAMGVPTIGSRIPGLIDSIEDGISGLFHEAGDIRGLADLMLDLASNPDKYFKLGVGAKERAKKYFSANLMYRELRDLYLNQAKPL